MRVLTGTMIATMLATAAAQAGPTGHVNPSLGRLVSAENVGRTMGVIVEDLLASEPNAGAVTLLVEEKKWVN